jgi:hypothetical protein
MMKLASQVIHELRAINHQFPRYELFIKHAFAACQPVFAKDSFSKKYSELARNGEWFANSLVANACLEGYGAEQIWAFSNKLDNDVYASRVRKHSLDESRHSTMFITMLGLTFPSAVEQIDEETKSRIRTMQPHYSKNAHPPIFKPPPNERLFEIESISQLVQVHITEIRALVLQYMVRDALLKHAPEKNIKRLLKMSDSLISDEARHIAYSAEIFEDYSLNNKDFFFSVFEKHLADFNDLTQEELARELLDL